MNLIEMFYIKQDANPRFIKKFINFAIVFTILIAIFISSIKSIGVNLDFSVLKDFDIRIVRGFLMTLSLSFYSLIISLFIGIFTALGSNSKFLPIRYFCNIYVKFIRGTPLIMQIYLFFYIIGTAWGINNRFVAGVIILSIFEAAYISEIIRGSLLSLDKTQLEAAQSVGFTKIQTIKYIIIPQLIQRTLPALTGQFASIIKDSSLLSMIAVIELTQTMREITAINFKMFECYFTLGILYLIFTLPLSMITSSLEKRFKFDKRA